MSSQNNYQSDQNALSYHPKQRDALMAIYHLDGDRLKPLDPTSFAQAGVTERANLQRVLLEDIDIIAPDTLVLAEEFGNWEESRRRIDILGIDKNANIVVIELKRTDDGGHMELQAIRYAAMVSMLTFDGAVDIFARHLASASREDDARNILLEFLEWDEPDEGASAQEVHIVLAAADFSKEIATSVLWLNQQGLNIRCVRLRPYRDGDRLFLDVQQFIPLPEAEEYQVRIRDKARAERVARSQSRDLTKFDMEVGDQEFERLPKRRAIFHVIKHLCNGGVDPEEIRAQITWRGDSIRDVPGTLNSMEFEKVVREGFAREGRKTGKLRYFYSDDELIHRNDRTYAVTKMWGPRTDETMASLIEAFPGYDISFSPSPD